MSNVLEVFELSKSYGKLKAVDRLSFSLRPGEILGFLGPNGAGKTTTIKMLTGFCRPDAGKVIILGRELERNEVEIKRQIGVVSEDLQMYDRLSGRELLEFVARVHGIDDDVSDRRIARLLGFLELQEKEDIFIMDYSHGMKKKLSLACALIHKPQILFLDEPFNGMDPLSVIRVRQFLEELRSEGVSIFFSSHILEIVEKVCDRIAIMKKGVLQAIGTQSELLTLFNRSSLEEIFIEVGAPVA
jgi:ABC-2 type transport system ATP-binding protein